MAVFFGFVEFSKKVPIVQKEELLKTHRWDGARCFENFCEGFWSCISINPSFQYSISDVLWQDEAGEFIVLFSGQIYNREELFSSYLHFEKDTGNPEFSLFLFKKLGHMFVEKLNGDFSILIYNKKTKQAFLYRDHLGINPLSFCFLENNLFFSTDYMGLSKALFSNTQVSQSFLVQFLQDADYFEYTFTPSKEVIKLFPGHYAVFENTKQTIKKYWFPEKIEKNKKLSANEALKELNFLVKNAAKIRSDKKKIGAAHLSGGLDSGLVAALCRKEFFNQIPFWGFSWTPDIKEPSFNFFDERDLINQIKVQNKIDPVFSNISTSDYLDYISDWRYYSYQFYEHKILKEASQRKVNLIFSGWGGDEFISINNRGLYYDLFFNLNWITLFKKKSPFRMRSFASMVLFNILLPFFGLGYLKRRPKDKWSYKYFLSPFNKRPRRNKTLFNYRSRRDVHLGLLNNYHLPSRTETWAILGAHHGVEYRYPLLDKRIIEFILKVPSKVIASLPYTRPLIREVSKGILPEKVRLHTSKEDAVRLSKYYELLKKIVPIIKEELYVISQNPELDFVNFKLIEEDIRKVLEGTYGENEIDFLFLLSNIKQMHEFTIGYHK